MNLATNDLCLKGRNIQRAGLVPGLGLEKLSAPAEESSSLKIKLVCRTIMERSPLIIITALLLNRSVREQHIHNSTHNSQLLYLIQSGLENPALSRLAKKVQDNVMCHLGNVQPKNFGAMTANNIRRRWGKRCTESIKNRLYWSFRNERDRDSPSTQAH